MLVVCKQCGEEWEDNAISYCPYCDCNVNYYTYIDKNNNVIIKKYESLDMVDLTNNKSDWWEPFYADSYIQAEVIARKAARDHYNGR